jgi:cell division septation protein DedD
LTTAPATSSKTKSPAKTQWIVRIAAFPAQADAKKLESRLKTQYAVSVKHFEKSKVYSVRVGPYDSKVKAEAERVKLDKLLGTQSQVVVIP